MSASSLPPRQDSGLALDILFLCPHGAAKSVIAHALTQRIVAETGAAVVTSNAGTDPDDVVNPIAADALSGLSLAASGPPRLVMAGDIARADLVVSLGCAVTDLPSTPDRFIDWSDVPDASADVQALIAVLEKRITALLASHLA